MKSFNSKQFPSLLCVQFLSHRFPCLVLLRREKKAGAKQIFTKVVQTPSRMFGTVAHANCRTQFFHTRPSRLTFLFTITLIA